MYLLKLNQHLFTEDSEIGSGPTIWEDYQVFSTKHVVRWPQYPSLNCAQQTESNH